MQVYDVSEECITILSDDVKVTDEGDKADTCDIKKEFKDLSYAKYNENGHFVLATFVTTFRHLLQNLVDYIELSKRPIRAALRYKVNFTKYVLTNQNTHQSSRRIQAGLSVSCFICYIYSLADFTHSVSRTLSCQSRNFFQPISCHDFTPHTHYSHALF